MHLGEQFRRFHLNDFSVFSSGGQIFCSLGRNRFGQFGRGPYEEYLCEILLNLDQKSRNLLSSGSPGRRSSWFKQIPQRTVS